MLATVLLSVAVNAQGQLTAEDHARADDAIRTAFAYLYALAPDTAGAPMDSWVIDSSSLGPTDSPDRWRILVTKMTDTGQELKLSEMAGSAGTTPAQLAAAMRDMQRLEGKISKAEAEAAIEVIVTVNAPEMTLTGVSDDAQRTKPAIGGSQVALRVKGDWMRVDDRELEIDYERWSSASLLVAFGPYGAIETHRASPKASASTFVARARPSARSGGIQTIAVTVQGNEEMIDRVVRETKWELLAALVKN